LNGVLRSPLEIFISSSQREFRSLRSTLKEAIDTEEYNRQKIFKGVLIERGSGLIEEDIQDAMEDASIYIGIIGSRNSTWTKREFRIAFLRGLPIMIYRFQKKGTKRQSEMQVFLKNEVRSRSIRVRGPFRTEPSLVDAVLNDLAIQTAELAREAARVRKTIHKRRISASSP
jgi:hypothetical protein